MNYQDEMTNIRLGGLNQHSQMTGLSGLNQGPMPACEKRNTIADQLSKLNELVQRVSFIRANVREISDTINGGSGSPMAGTKTENTSVPPQNLLWRLTEFARTSAEIVSEIERELSNIRSALGIEG